MLEREFVLHLEYRVLRYAHFVAVGEVFQKSLKLLYGLDSKRLVELRLGGVEVVAISAIVPCQFGVFAFGIAGIVELEILTGACVVLVLIIAEGKQIERFFGFLAALEYCDAVF